MELREQLEQAMRQIGRQMMTDTDFSVHNKHGNYDFVTDADVRTQERLRTAFSAFLPEAAFLSEEDLSQTPAPGQLYWMIDPIDGTTNFMHDLGLSCIAAALCRDGEPLAGAVYHPWRDEFFFAEQGKGADCNGHTIHVSGRDFSDALVTYGQGYGERNVTIERMRPLIEKSYIECRGIRALGVAEVSLCWIACGRLDLYFEQAVMPWDYAAGGLILREAGGVCTNWRGRKPSMTEGDSLLAGNKRAYSKMFEVAGVL